MPLLESYRDVFEKHIAQKTILKEPLNLYEPIRYIMNIGGKRLRPLFVLIGCDVFRKPYENGLDAALAVELFHNFSLIHDDIMDNAPLRRGKQTVHEKWDVNTGILSGDALLILAYQLFENYPPEIFRQLAILFSKTAIEVCEGQQLDMDFENREDVTVSEYLNMITCKTAVLIGAALKMGAIVAEATETEKENIYQFGENLGIAFQLQDDYLDAFGDSETFGKQSGGDIIANKKTFLYLNALKNASPDETAILRHLFSIRPGNPEDKIQTVKKIYVSSGAEQYIKDKIEKYTQEAVRQLEILNISNAHKVQLTRLAEQLIYRIV